MIDFISKKYGKVRIYETIEAPLFIPIIDMTEFSLIGFRNPKTGTTTLLKNRYGPRDDRKTIDFIANYSREQFNPIESRWEILDL